MCGIAGIIDLSDALINTETVAEMCGAMTHRGPDSNGLVALPHAVLGFRRLAILDTTSSGNQPMCTSDGRYWIVFNGEIYNHVELRNELGQSGYHFQSRTDTEVILNGFAAWGAQIEEKCRGMWAFAIWDSASRRLHLSRDRTGEKPLFYYADGPRLAFASTLGALRSAIGKPQISSDAVASLLAYQYIPTTESIYRGVKKLPPAHALQMDGSGVRVQSYWNLDYRNKLDISVNEAETEIERILDTAVQEQLEADVPVGVFLSGGIDSGYITALAAKKKPGIVSITMSVPDDPSRDEAEEARRLAKLHRTTHIEVVLDQDCIKDLPSLLSRSEPLADSSIIPVSAVSSAASQYMTVVLTGDGGDESFDGYGLARMAAKAHAIRNRPEGRFFKILSPGMRFLSQQRITPGLRFMRGHCSGPQLMAGAGLEAWFSTAGNDQTSPDVRRMIFGPALVEAGKRSHGEYLIAQLNQGAYREWWEGVLLVGMKTRLVDDFLVKVDTASMHHSIEARAPFLDYRLLEFAAKLPIEIMMPDPYSKSLLRRIAARVNPPDIVYRQKKGFSIPVEKYFLGGWKNVLLELTRNGVAAQLGLLDPNGIRRLANRHGLRNSYRIDKLLYSILVLEIWLRVFHAQCDSAEELGDRLLAKLRN